MDVTTTEKLKEKFIEDVWKGMFLGAIFAGPASVIRVTHTGLSYVYIIHGLLALFVVACFPYRRKLQLQTRVILATIILYLTAVPALIQFGFYSNALLFLVIATLICATYFPRVASYAFVVVSLLVIVVAFGFANGKLVLPMSADAFIHTMTAWVGVLASTIIFLAVVVKGLTRYSSALVDLNQQLKAQKELVERMASHDALTNLPSLRLATDRLDMAIVKASREDTKVALLYIDLDGFKAINDQYGHDAGDQLLKMVAEQITSCVRKSDTCCRIGGDEFMVILPDLASTSSLQELSQKLLSGILTPLSYNGEELQVGASIGCAVFPDHAESAGALRKLADTMMYDVKRQGKNGFKIADCQPVY